MKASTDRLIGYSVERAVYGPPLPAMDDAPTGNPIHQFDSDWITRSKSLAAEVAQRLAVKNGGRFFLVRYSERSSKPIDSWTTPPRWTSQ